MISWSDSLCSVIETASISIKWFFGLSLGQHRLLNNRKHLDRINIIWDAVVASEGPPIQTSLNKQIQ